MKVIFDVALFIKGKKWILESTTRSSEVIIKNQEWNALRVNESEMDDLMEVMDRYMELRNRVRREVEDEGISD